MSGLFDWLSGRTTAFCLGFFVSGNVLHWFHRLDSTYITFMTVLMGFVIGKSVQDDVKDYKNKIAAQ